MKNLQAALAGVSDGGVISIIMAIAYLAGIPISLENSIEQWL